MSENGTYSPKMGRPVNDVNYIRESMSLRETLRTGPQEIGPEPEQKYPTATELMDDLYKAIELLEMETAGLIQRIDFVLTEDSPQCEPIPGPRVSTSVITYRIAHAADLIDDLTRRVNNIRRRITL